MNIEEIRLFCLSFPMATECLPFDDTSLVFKVENKMFALLSLDPGSFGMLLKCDPDKAVELREKHNAVQPGFHMNKKYWNSIDISAEVKDNDLKEWITHSFCEVIAKLPKQKRDNLQNLLK